MPVESAVRANAPYVNGGRWNGPYRALDYQRFVDSLLSRLERVAIDCSEVAFGTINVKGAHRVRELKAQLANDPPQRGVQVVAVQVLNAIHNRDFVGTYTSRTIEQVPTEALLWVLSEFERFVRAQGIAIIVTVLAEHAF